MGFVSKSRKLLGGGFARQLMRHSFVAFAIKVASAALSFGMFAALARATSPEEFGRFSFGFSLASFLALVALMGQRNLILRFVPIYATRNQPGHLKGLVQFSYGLVMSVALAFVLFGLVLHWILPDLVPGYLLASLVLILPMAVSDLQSGLYRGLGMVAGAISPRDIFWRLLIILCILPVIFEWGPAWFPHALTGQSAIWLSVAVLSLVTVAQVLVRRDLLAVLSAPALAVRETATWRHTALGLWLNTVMQTGFQHAVVVFLGLLLSPAATGSFFAAFKTSLLLNFFLLAANIVSAPHISRLWAQGHRVKLQKLCMAVSLGAFAPTAMLFVVFVFFGDHILGLFGESYTEAYTVLIILALGQLINTACGQTGVLLSMTGNERRLLKYVVLSNLISVALLFTGVPIFGAVFGAIAIAAGFVGWNIMAAIWAFRHLKVNPTILAFLKPKQDQT
jgi:O-antigen/teichoic acid export membrane protein